MVYLRHRLASVYLQACPKVLRKSFVSPSVIKHRSYTRSPAAMANNSLSKPRPVVGVVQMTSGASVDENLTVGRALIGRAKNLGAEMVFLPECFDHICENRADTLKVSQALTGDIIQQYKDTAKKLNVWLSLGGFHEKPNPSSAEHPNKLCNTHLVIDNQGEILATYSKTHLFDVDIKNKVRLKESDFIIPGNTIRPPVKTPVGNIGMGICYDLRFPEFSTALTQQGAQILTYPSAFTIPTGMAHWETLLRCRAIENQCYVIAAAQVGKHNAKRSSYGHSMVVDPWGCIIAECHDHPDVCVAQIDLEYLTKKREEMPVWNHRRHDLYGHIQVQCKGDIDAQSVYQFGQYTVPATAVFYKSALSVAFVNKKPVLPDVLICPIRSAERFTDLTSAETADLFSMVKQVAAVIEKQYGASSSTIAIQDGPEAGQTVKHVHVHILPRKKGDFENNDDIYDKLEKHDKDERPSQWRTDEDMAQEAAQLRPLFYDAKL